MTTSGYKEFANLKKRGIFLYPRNFTTLKNVRSNLNTSNIFCLEEKLIN